MTLARIQRWAMILSGYDYALSYHSGDQDSNVGCMSRLNFNLDREIEFFTMDKRVSGGNRTCCNFKEVTYFTKCDSLLSKVCNYINHGWPNIIE